MDQLNAPEKTTLQNCKNQNKVYRLLRALLLTSVMMSFACFVKSQTTITAIQSGDWNDPATWDAATIPTVDDDVVISNGFTVTVTSADEACNNMMVGVGDGFGSGTIAFSGASSLTVPGTIFLGDPNGATGTISMDAAATLTAGAVEEGDPTYSGIYETNLGTIVLTGSFTLPFNFFQFNNLIITGTVTSGGRNLQIEGDLTVDNGGTLDIGVNSANRNTISGTFLLGTNSTLKIGGGGTIPANFSTHAIDPTSTIEYYGVSQTVATLNSSQNYGNLVISGSGLKEVNGTIGIAGDLTVNAGIFSVNTSSANRTSAGGTLTVANGATLRISGSGTIPANFDTHVIGSTSTIEYNGTSTQTVAVLNSGQNYGNLTVTNSVKNLGGSITVAGTLAFGGTPNRLVIGSNTLTLQGTITGSLTSSRNFTGSSTSNLVLSGAFSRTLFLDATTIGTTNVLNNLTLNHNSSVTTLGNDVVVNGNLTFTAGKLAIAARTLTIKGDFVNTAAGGLRGGSTSKLIINTSSNPTLSMDQTTAGTTNALSTLQINSTGKTVTMAGNLVMNSTLTFTAGKLAVNGNTLTLKGLVTNTVSGGIVGSSNSNLIINGTVSPSLSFDQTTPGTTNVFKNLTFNSSGQTATLLNSLRLTGTCTPTAGTLATGGNLTIGSNASATGSIAAGSAAGGYITGDVTVERYIPQNTNRAWRLLASPTSGQTIHEAWQESQAAGVNGSAGYGTIITSKDATWASNGFDYKTANYSMYSYDAANDELVPVTSTAASIAGEPGYFIYIRGSRSVTPSSSIAAVDATTLRSTGTLYTGDQPASNVDADRFGIIGNPYASAIDLRNVATSGGCTATSFYVWDPKLLGSYNVGGIQTLTPSGGNYIVVPGGGSYGASGSIVNTIESGAAFFVQATGSAGTVTITESSKTSGSNLVFRPQGSSSENKLYINLYAVAGSQKNIADGSILFFADNYDNGIDGYDSRKQSNFGENLFIISSTSKLVAERRNFPAKNDSIQLAITGMKKMAYQLQLFGNPLQDNSLAAFLKDSYLNKEIFIVTGDTTTYDFTIDANAASAAEKRFSIVFKQTTPLALTVKSVKAYQQSSKIAVEWQVTDEINMLEYVVEKSLDGKNFYGVASVAADNAGSYKWLDANTADGANYYRIKCIDESGKFSRTQIAKVFLGTLTSALSIFPNPVEGGIMNVQFINQAKGTYKLRLISNAGQVVYQNSLTHNGGSASQSVNLPAKSLGGTYQLEILMPDKTRQVQQVILVTK